MVGVLYGGSKRRLVFMKRISNVLVPLQMIRLFPRGFVHAPGQMPRHKSTEWGTMESCHMLDICTWLSAVFVAGCSGLQQSCHYSHCSSLSLWSFTLCVFKVQHRKSSMVLAANHSAAVIVVMLKGFLDGVEHIEIYKRDEREGKSYNIVRLLHKSWS